MTLHHTVRQQLLGNLTQPQPDEAAQLNNALRLLSKWRSVLIQNTLLQHQGAVVMEGPIKGMDFLPQSAEGCQGLPHRQAIGLLRAAFAAVY